MSKQRMATLLVFLVLFLVASVSAAGQQRQIVRVFAPVAPDKQLSLKILIERNFPHVLVQVDGPALGRAGFPEPVMAHELAERMAAGDYDVVVYNAGTQYFVSQRLLADLDAFVSRTGFGNPLFPSMRIAGRLYDLPVFIEPYVVVYNRALFDRAGIPYPQVGWTWDEFVGAAVAAGDEFHSDPIYGAVFHFDSMLDFILNQQYSDPINAGEEELGYALSIISTFATSNAPLADTATSMTHFGAGQAAMQIIPLNLALLLDSGNRGTGEAADWGLAPLPSMPGQPGANVLMGITTVSVTSRALNPLLAWEVAEVIATQGYDVLKIAHSGLSAYANAADVDAWVDRVLPPNKADNREELRAIMNRPNVFQDRGSILTNQQFRMALFETTRLLIDGEATADALLADLIELRDYLGGAGAL